MSKSDKFLAAMLTAAGLSYPVSAWAASAPMKCIDVQVNEGESPISVQTLHAVLPAGGCVRDVLGWHIVEQVQGQHVMPARQWQEYQNVAAAGMVNVVTLGFGNAIYGSNGYQTTINDFGLPVTAQQVEAFKNYAVWVVSHDGASGPDAQAANIPNLYAVSLWNELNGTWNGGITYIPTRIATYARLVNTVGPAIRAANPDVKVIVGATVGANIGGWYTQLFANHMWGKNDPNVWLDVHPYIGAALTPANQNVPQLAAWSRSMTRIRSAGINNALFATEWGGGVADLVETNNPGLNYLGWMQQNLFAKENFAGTAWFAATPFGSSAKAALVLSVPGPVQTTKLGAEFIQW